MNRTQAAEALGVPEEWLWALINVESRWNPKAANQRSTARGLMQWINSRARELGFADSLDLITKAPTVETQLPLVVRDLKKYAPFGSLTEFALSVFAPAFRKKPQTPLSAEAQRVNPGLKTYADYASAVIKMARKYPGSSGGASLLPMIGAAVLGAAALAVRNKAGI